MTVLPIVLLEGGSTQAAGRPQTSAAPGGLHLHQRVLHRIALVDNRVTQPSTPTTAAPTTTVPVTSPPTTAAQPVPTPAPVAQAVAPAPTTTTTAGPSHHQTGLATWYAWRSGQCASPTLPMGTTVWVTNVSTGASASCLVTDREAANPGRVIDLDTSVFQAIAPLSAGAVTVTIGW